MNVSEIWQLAVLMKCVSADVNSKKEVMFFMSVTECSLQQSDLCVIADLLAGSKMHSSSANTLSGCFCSVCLCSCMVEGCLPEIKTTGLLMRHTQMFMNKHYLNISLLVCVWYESDYICTSFLIFYCFIRSYSHFLTSFEKKFYLENKYYINRSSFLAASITKILCIFCMKLVRCQNLSHLFPLTITYSLRQSGSSVFASSAITLR